MALQLKKSPSYTSSLFLTTTSTNRGIPVLSTVYMRDARAADLQAITDIFNYSVTFSTTPCQTNQDTVEEFTEWWNHQRQQGYPVIVAVKQLGVQQADSDQLVGFASYTHYRDVTDCYTYTVEHYVYIAAGHHKQGIGSFLLQQLIAHARAAGKVKMIGVMDIRVTGGIKLHQKHGFEPCAYINRAAYKFGLWIDLVLYQLQLANTDAAKPLIVGSNITTPPVKPRVLCVCCTGDVAYSTVYSLLKYHNNDVDIMLMVRPNSNHPEIIERFQQLGIGVIRADLLADSVNDIKDKIAPHLFTAVVALLGNIPFELISTGQRKLIEAVVQIPSIKLFVPSEFGIDHAALGRQHALGWALNKKDDIRQLLKQVHATIRPDLHHTFVVTNAFTEWLFNDKYQRFYGVDLSARTIRVPVSGETRLTTTCVADIGRITAAAVVAGVKGDPSVLNQTVGCCTATLSYNDMQQLLEAHYGEKFTTTVNSVEQLQDMANAALKVQNYLAAASLSYAVVIANGVGVHRKFEDSWNYKHQVPTTNIHDWIKQRLKVSSSTNSSPQLSFLPLI